MGKVEADVARAHLERIVASDGFRNSERLCRFLRFTVEAHLSGHGDRIKEYLIGREVFDRNNDYDPRTDPIVRVEARRLRKKLEEYYAGVGREERARIAFPKGSYEPEIYEVGAAAVVFGNWKKWILGATVLLAAGLSMWMVLRPRAEKLVVLPARCVWKADEFTQTPLDVDLAERVGAELANRYGVNVAAWPSLQKYGRGDFAINDIARQVGAARALLISVRVEASGTRVTAFLMDTVSDRKIRVTDKEGRDLASAELRDQVAREVAAEFATSLR